MDTVKLKHCNVVLNCTKNMRFSWLLVCLIVTEAVDINLRQHLMSDVSITIHSDDSIVNQGFRRLSTDLIPSIARFLTPQNIHNLAATSKVIHNACNLSQHHWHHQHLSKDALLEERFVYLLRNTNLTIYDLASLPSAFIGIKGREITSFCKGNPTVTSVIGIDKCTKTGFMLFQLRPVTDNMECNVNSLFGKRRYVLMIDFQEMTSPVLIIYQYRLFNHQIKIHYFRYINNVSFVEQIINVGQTEIDNTTWILAGNQNKCWKFISAYAVSLGMFATTVLFVFTVLIIRFLR